MRSKLLILTLVIVFTIPAAVFPVEPIYQEAKVYFDNTTDVNSLFRQGLDIISYGEDYIIIVTNQNEIDSLNSMGFRTEIIHEDLVAFYQSRLAAKDMGGYMTLSEINDAIDSIISQHGSIVSSKISIGKTIENRDIWAFKISDNPQIDETEPEILFFGAIHAREVITPLVLLYFIDYLTDNYGIDPEATDIVNNREVWFVLPLNPDGYYYNEVTYPDGGGLWRKNRRFNAPGVYGVDLNRNFGYNWGYDNEGSSFSSSSNTYRGTAPFSEPETQAIRNFIEAHEFIITISYHSSGNKIIWPWGYDYIYSPDEKLFSWIGDSVNSLNNYSAGPTWEQYYLVNGGSDDWGYGETNSKNKCISLTVEVGTSYDGFWPNPARIPDLVQENLEPNKFYCQIAENVYQMVPPVEPQIHTFDTVPSSVYTINWSHYDTANPAVEYELVEKQYRQAVTDLADTNSNWDFKKFVLTDLKSYSPPTSYYSTQGNKENTYMQTKFPYLVKTNDSLKFKTYYDIEDGYDYAYVQVSTNGYDFISIPGNITTTTNIHGENRGNGITGNSGDAFIDAEFDLSAYEGMRIDIRFNYITNDLTYGGGIYIDDIYPVDSFETVSIISSSITDTFYTFTNHVVGEYFYQVRAKDAENQWSDISSYHKTEVISDSECLATGDIDNDGTPLTISDYNYFNDILNGFELVPDSIQRADFDGNGIINLNDSLLLDCYINSGNDLACLPSYPISTSCNIVLDFDSDGKENDNDYCPYTAIETYYIDRDDDLYGDISLSVTACEQPVGYVENNLDCNDYDSLVHPLADELCNGEDDDCNGEIDEHIVTQLIGDVNNNGSLEYADLTFLRDFLYNNGTAPPNPPNADVNGDCRVNVGDIINILDAQPLVDCTCENPDITACCFGMRGNIDYDESDGLDISDLLYLVDYMFLPPGTVPDPPCFEEGNVDALGTEVPDISDLLYLVDYMFLPPGDAPAPVACP